MQTNLNPDYSCHHSCPQHCPSFVDIIKRCQSLWEIPLFQGRSRLSISSRSCFSTDLFLLLCNARHAYAHYCLRSFYLLSCFVGKGDVNNNSTDIVLGLDCLTMSRSYCCAWRQCRHDSEGLRSMSIPTIFAITKPSYSWRAP